MATTNPFDLLGDDDNDDLSQLIAKKAALAPTTTAPTQQQQPKQPAKLPSKPAPPAQAVREAKSEGRGGGRGGGRGDYGRGRGGGGYNRDRSNNENSFNNNGMSAPFASPEDGGVEKSSERRGGYGGGPRGSFRGGRRGGNNNGEFDGEQRRNRVFERRSGTGRGNEIKREGSGRGNWGSAADEIAPDSEEVPTATENVNTEKQPAEEVTADTAKENPVAEPEEKEPEEKEMTLDEYQKILEEKKKALPGANTETRKVEVDKELKSMQPLASKKSNFDVFIKLGSDKDKRKEIADKDEKAKKAVSITEFLKPAEGERGYYPGGRGRGRGRGPRGGGFNGGSNPVLVEAPKIEDPGQFPNLK